jgi:hypothetical protein
MFERDQLEIENWAHTPERMVDVATMVLLSIRMQWVGVGNQMRDVRANGANAKSLWGFKRAGYVYLRDNREALYRRVEKARAGEIYIDDLMRDFLKVPGLGLPKAGFVVQLLTGEAGCLDMHNVKRFGLDVSAWKIRTLVDTDAQLREIDDKINYYLALVDACGGSMKLWNDWCEYLNDKVSTFTSADDVSRRHFTYLNGEQG